MAKFVCDFDVVNSVAKNLSVVSENLTRTMSNYELSLKSDLSGWSGDAKNSFISSTEQKVSIIKSKLQSIEELSNFIKKAADAISQLDNELASLDI